MRAQLDGGHPPFGSGPWSGVVSGTSKIRSHDVPDPELRVRTENVTMQALGTTDQRDRPKTVREARHGFSDQEAT